jgi:HPt (histidine-containing phosphotransfer) domain-containing protein
MSDELVLDPEAIESLRSLNPGDNDAFLRELTELFLDDVPQRLSELEVSMAGGDLSGFIRAAHSIKGSSANLGAIALKVSAEKLEQQARICGLIDIAPLIEDIRTDFSRTRTALEDLTR